MELRHEGIVSLLEHGQDGAMVCPGNDVKAGLKYIVMEYVPHNLLDFSKTMGAMGEDAGKFFLSQIINVVAYIHQLGVVHRDLKFENIALDTELNLKLLDFGLASRSNIDSLTDMVGSILYMSPEIHEGNTYSGTKADLFSVGVILYQIVTGKSPFSEASKEDLFYSQLVEGQIENFFQMKEVEHLSSGFKDLITRLLAYDPSERPTIDEIRSHSWMREKTIQIEIQPSDKLQKFSPKKNFFSRKIQK